MVTLLQNYSISEILIFIIIVALAVKSLISFFDWAYDRIRKLFDKNYKKLDEKKALKQQLNDNKKMIKDLQDKQNTIDSMIEQLSKEIRTLIESDKDSIRAYITEKHHYFCYQKHWIDDFSLDCLEKRYSHYTHEGGNSFIKGFMDDLRQLPSQDPSIKS